MKPQAEVLTFGAYMFESLQNFNNSQVKAHSMFSMSNLQVFAIHHKKLFTYIHTHIHYTIKKLDVRQAPRFIKGVRD